MKKVLIAMLLVGILCSCFIGLCFATDVQASTDKGNTRAAESWDCDGDGALEILAIGNSFSVDGLQYVYDVAKSLGISKVTLGNLYIGGCSLETHYTNAKNDSAAYTYYFNNSGSWTTTKSYKISKAIASQSWDYISMQQNSGNSGLESTYNSNLTNLISYVKNKLPSGSKTKLIWHMTWAYQKDSTHSSFANYSKNQSTMYKGIVAAVQNKILTNSNFSMVIPCGTAVQNVRSSYTGDTLTRDGYHMSYGQGRYLLALMWVKQITGLSIDKIKYRPSDVDDQFQYVAIEAVNKAYSKPYAITKSTFTGKDPVNKYVLLQPTLTKCAYWNSNNANYNTLIKDASNSPNFYATVRFTKEELPVGSIIVLSSGWKYRADGWVTDTKQSSRPDATTASYTIVTDEWWGNYTIRGFNISKSTATDLSSTSASTIRNAFKIYVPEKTLENNYLRIYPQITMLGYWNSTAAAYNKINTTANNSKYFACTPRLTKEQLPVGSVILVTNGWQYRPEGWVTDAKQSSRLDPVSTMSVYCTSSWWGSYTLRAFNISMVETTDISGKTESNIHSYFRIWVPKSAHKHTYDSGSVTTAATCAAAGVKTYTCTLCRQKKTESIPALSHTTVSDPAVAPTCTLPGKTAGSHCSVCNKVIVAQDAVPATGHTEIFLPAKEATCTASGLTEGVLCSVCNETLTAQEPIPAKGHTEVADAGVPPTCTVPGLTQGSHCDLCKEVILARESIPATGHTEQPVPAQAPTCTATGLTEGKICSVCEEILLAQEELPALGHSWNYRPTDSLSHELECTLCGAKDTQAHSFFEGQCICGEQEVLEPQLDPNLTINHTLNLASDISVNYLVPVQKFENYDPESIYLECTMMEYDGNTATGKQSYRITPKQVGVFYYFTLDGLTAVHMSNELTAVVHGTQGRQAYYSALDTYSIADYAYAQLNKTAAGDTLKTLCAQLLRYGSAAQQYKEYRTDSLADSRMTDAHRAYLIDPETVIFGNCNEQGTELANPSVLWKGKALDLNTKVSVIYIIDASAYKGNADDLTLHLTYTDCEGVECELILNDPKPYGSGQGFYSFTMDKLLASELRTILTAQVYAGEDAVSVTLKYSPDTYGNGKTGALQSLCKALIAYADSAKAYF